MRLKPWNSIPHFWPGDVLDTIPSTQTGPLALVHLDLNASAPTEHVLRHVYDRLVPGRRRGLRRRWLAWLLRPARAHRRVYGRQTRADHRAADWASGLSRGAVVSGEVAKGG